MSSVARKSISALPSHTGKNITKFCLRRLVELEDMEELYGACFNT